MWQKIKNNLGKKYKWFQKNAMNIFVVMVIHIIASYILALPYFNLLSIVFSFLYFFIDWIVILVLFKPKKENVLKVGLFLFLIGYPLAIVNASGALEILGNMSYLLLVTYILFSLKEIKSE